MKRQYFFIPGLTAEKKTLDDAMQKTLEGDECFVHYHQDGQTCNDKCHLFEIRKKDEE